MAKEPDQFVLCRPPIPLIALPNQPKAFESDARQLHWLDCYLYTMHCRSVRQDKFNCTDVLTQSDWTRTLFCALSTEPNKALPVQLPDPERAEFAL